MIDDAMFERDLKAMLAARDPGPARPELSLFVRTRISANGGDVRRLPGAVRSAGGLAAVAVIAAIVVLAIVVARPDPIGPGSGPIPAPSSAYSLKPGDGVTTADVPIFQFLAALVIVTGLGVVALTMTRRRLRIGASLAGLAIVFVATRVGTSDALAFTDGGYGVTPTRAAGEGESGMIVAATGDEPFTLFLTVTNNSSLPLTIKGVPEPAVHTIGSSRGTAHLPRFVGIAGLSPEGMTSDTIQPFQPITIEPGGDANIAILGLPGTCAVPNRGSGGSYGIDQVSLVYEQLTIDHQEDFVLPEPITIPIAMPCP